jgi:uncharacterized membrane protein YdbT with pleckstrin-like domain
MANLVIRSSLKGVYLTFALGVLALMAAGFVYTQNPNESSPLFWVFIFIMFVLDAWGLMKMVRIGSRRLTLEQDSLRFEEGLASKSQRNIILDKVRDVSMTQSFGQRLIGVGDLSVEALGESGHITLNNVDSPRQAADAILEAMRQSRQSKR